MKPKLEKELKIREQQKAKWKVLQNKYNNRRGSEK